MRDNWGKGTRGFQSRLDASQQKALYECWVQNNWKNKPARALLKNSFGIELPERTLGDYKKRLRERKENTADHPIDWSDFTSISINGIPSHLLYKLHYMAETIELLSLEANGTLLTSLNLKPTYRNVKWWAYLIQYYESTVKSVHDRQFISEQYATREFISESNGTKIDNEDLERWLLYKPWESSSNECIYLKAISTGKIPPLDYSKFNYGSEGITIKKPYEVNLLNSHMSIMNKFIELAPKPYLLPSQILKNYAEEIIPIFEKKYIKEESTNIK